MNEEINWEGKPIHPLFLVIISITHILMNEEINWEDKPIHPPFIPYQ
jgi:hypothetical protein